LKIDSITEIMTDTDTTDRFVIEVSQVGTVDHIVDLEADPASGPSYSSRRELPGKKLCDRSTRSPANEYITLRDYADWKGFDKMAFEGDAPDEVCSYCWTAVVEHAERGEQHECDDVDERIGTVGYRLRWKQKGRAREEWYDIVVRPETTSARERPSSRISLPRSPTEPAPYLMTGGVYSNRNSISGAMVGTPIRGTIVVGD